MINTYMNVSAQELIEGCLQPDEEAWWAFYERFGGMLQRALRRALGARAADASVVDEVMQDVRLYIYRGRAATKIEMENGVRSGNDRWFLKTSINTREQTPCLQLHPNPPFLASTRTRSRECCLASIA